MIEKMSEDFIVTARKWRPQKYKDVVGQEHITQTLQNSIKAGRVHHANLFCGPRGVGKTTTARIHARALNCLNLQDFEPCNECESCLSILRNTSMDVIEIDGASNNSVEDVRKLRDSAKYPPSVGKYKMFIIDEVHMLSTSAFNALLKILEEPPKHLIFVFATTESHKVPATIISRCQRFDFRRMEIENIVSQLKYISEQEGITIDETSLVTIAKKGDGSMRDSQSIFDRAIAFCGKEVSFQVLAESLHLIDQEFYFKIGSQIKNKQIGELFLSLNEVISKGYDLIECLRGLIEYYRNILAIKETGNAKLIDTTESYLQRYKKEAEDLPLGDLLRYINYLMNTEKELKFASQPRIKFELALIQLASMNSVMGIEMLISELKEIKQISLEVSEVSGNKEISNQNEKKKLELEIPDRTAKDDKKELITENKIQVRENIAENKDSYSSAGTEVTTKSEDTPLTQADINRIWKKLELGNTFKHINFSNLKECVPLLREELFDKQELVILTKQEFIAELFKTKRQQILEIVHKYIGPLEVSCEVENTEDPTTTYVGEHNVSSPYKQGDRGIENTTKNSHSNRNSNRDLTFSELPPNIDHLQEEYVFQNLEQFNSDEHLLSDNIRQKTDELIKPIFEDPNVIKNDKIDVSKLTEFEKYIVEYFNADLIIES